MKLREYFTRQTGWLWLLFLSLCLPLLCPAQEPAPLLHPKTYTSPTGNFTCEIDPSQNDGAGEGTYRIQKQGQLVWTGNQPFTLQDAQITDDGIISGYAYSHGRDSWGKGLGRNEYGNLLIIIMRANGELILNETIKREFCGRMHSPPMPVAENLAASAAADRLLIELGNCSGSEWRSYKLSTGKRVQLNVPSEVKRLGVEQIEPVNGSPLFVAYSNSGSKLLLLDASLHSVWTQDLPKNNQPGDWKSRAVRIRAKARTDGVILPNRTTNQFSIYDVATEEQVAFEVKSSSQGNSPWTVKEAGRIAYPDFLGRNGGITSFAEKTLKHLGTFPLQPKHKEIASPIRSIVCFDLDENGNFGFIRRDKAGQYSFVMVDPEGKMLREIQLPAPKDPAKSNAPLTTWLMKDRWLITASSMGVGGNAAAWWLDTAGGKLEPIPDFKAPAIEDVTGARDGSFVALATTRQQYSMTDELITFDSRGQTLWQQKESTDSKPSSFFASEAVTLTAQREIALLSNVRNLVQFYDLSGKYLRTWKLETLLGRKPSYPTIISADSKGGVLIFDFNGNPPLLHLDATGKSLAQMEMKYADGRVISHVRGAKADQAGAIWISDGECIARLDKTGTVDLILGNAPSTNALGKVAAATIDQKGQTYLADERTGAVHVYDATGKHLRTCLTDARDFDGKLIMPNLGVGNDGSVYLQPDFRLPLIQFAPDGSRIGRKTFDLDSITQKIFPLAKENQMLVLGYKKAFITDEKGNLLKTIERCPDRQWLENMTDASVAPDGSFVIVTGYTQAHGGWQVHLYSAMGEPIKTVRMNEEFFSHCFVYTGKHLITCSATDIHLFNASGEPLQKIKVPAPALKEYEIVFFAPFDGKELWLLDKTQQAVHKYELP